MQKLKQRANADTNLKSQVDKVNIDLNTEVSKREAGDTVLQQNIDKEISDRTSADTLLDNKFTGLMNTESTAGQMKMRKSMLESTRRLKIVRQEMML